MTSHFRRAHARHIMSLCVALALAPAPLACAAGTAGTGAEGEGEGEAAVIHRTCSFASACRRAFELTVDYSMCQDKLRLVFGGFQAVDPPTRAAIDTVVTCAAAVDTCSEYLDCLVGGDDGFCAEVGGAGGGCNGDTLVSCVASGDTTPDAVDCTALGMTCQDDACVAATDPCGVDDPPLSCVDDDTVRMCSGLRGDVKCPAGTQCTDLGGDIVCASVGACAADAVSCAGDVAGLCSGGKQFQIDCAAFDRTCDPAQLCAPAGSACTPNNFTETCEGDALRVCREGELVELSCADFGRTTCAAGGLAGRPGCT